MINVTTEPTGIVDKLVEVLRNEDLSEYDTLDFALDVAVSEAIGASPKDVSVDTTEGADSVLWVGSYNTDKKEEISLYLRALRKGLESKSLVLINTHSKYSFIIASIADMYMYSS